MSRKARQNVQHDSEGFTGGDAGRVESASDRLQRLQWEQVKAAATRLVVIAVATSPSDSERTKRNDADEALSLIGALSDAMGVDASPPNGAKRSEAPAAPFPLCLCGHDSLAHNFSGETSVCSSRVCACGRFVAAGRVAGRGEFDLAELRALLRQSVRASASIEEQRNEARRQVDALRAELVKVREENRAQRLTEEQAKEIAELGCNGQHAGASLVTAVRRLVESGRQHFDKGYPFQLGAGEGGLFATLEAELAHTDLAAVVDRHGPSPFEVPARECDSSCGGDCSECENAAAAEASHADEVTP